MLPDDTEIARLYAYPATDRPWVRSNFVTTLDGAAHAADGRSGSLGGDVDTHVFGILRSLADVVVVGAGTARAEGYGPADVPIAVVSRRLDIPERLVVPGQLVITTADAPAVELARLRDVDVIALGTGTIDWPAVLAELGRRGLDKVLCEGGPSLHGDLVDLDLVDELCLTIAPVLSSGDAPRIAHGPTAVDRPMTRGHVLDVDGVLLTRWLRDRA
ncbi:MAG: pyrimidine reductase family protein [Aeromicrobium sp.]|jgi:riboflavin biosynthesis pyrimidine reductase|uniref:dihydrofolate reductase family protein n=1 Tax=Aeromicrobium sp. TaxID=1871063 RepID=UPI0026034A53|nr:dihydrofolate reductase family protein [Aeromicrobium sp.]MCW2788387.1 pyrimidine reductase family protein [Aeromicrobium sp.]MCW2825654.1 pyrimidine reductase family protein [Aeromicrobium sp.]